MRDGSSRRLRRIRRWATAHLAHAALRAAPLLPEPAIESIELLVAALGPRLPLLARAVRDNMRSAGVYSPRAHREYFERMAGHLAGALHVFRHAEADEIANNGGPWRPMPPALEGQAREQIRLDESLDVLRAAADRDGGVILAAPHMMNYLLALARLNLELPITVYLRHSKDPRRDRAKRLWCRTCGLGYIAEPARATDPTHRAALMHEALAQRRILVVTPDLPQKNDAGVPVRFLGREIRLPSGAAAMSLLSGAPLVAVLSRPAGRGSTLVFAGSREAETGRGRGWRQAAIGERMQWFAGLFDRFLRVWPALWYLWGDNRWTRVFRGDRRYVRPAGPGAGD